MSLDVELHPGPIAVFRQLDWQCAVLRTARRGAAGLVRLRSRCCLPLSAPATAAMPPEFVPVSLSHPVDRWHGNAPPALAVTFTPGAFALMATPAQRRLSPKEIRRFGSGRESHVIARPDADPDRKLPGFPPGGSCVRKAQGPRPGRRAPRDLPDRELRQDDQARVPPVRTGQAALHARRVPPAAPDLRPAVPRLAAAEQGAADRGRGLSRRHADHARRRRVHHQRRRARRRQPVAPQPRRRFRDGAGRRPATASCRAAASFPSAAAGSRSTSPRRTRSASASTRAASSPR